jgi:hypothetical protein
MMLIEMTELMMIAVLAFMSGMITAFLLMLRAMVGRTKAQG